MKSDLVEGMQRYQSYVAEKLMRESAVQRDIGKSVERDIEAEVGGVESVRQDRVSPDIYPLFKGVMP